MDLSIRGDTWDVDVMERKNMQQSMRRHRRVVLPYLVATVTLAAAALAANTAIEPVSNAGNASWTKRATTSFTRVRNEIDCTRHTPFR
jgi:predicted metal-binding membrane protein